MRKSEHGKQIFFYWEGFERLENVVLGPVESELKVTKKEQEAIDAKEMELEKDPVKFNGYLWGFKTAEEEGGKLSLLVRPVRYAQHAVLKAEERAMEDYPNPLGVTVCQETADGYFPLGVQGTGNSRELVLLGSGFVDREKDGTSLEAAIKRELLEETSYGSNRFYENADFLKERANVVAVTFGSRKDTGVTVHLPIPVGYREVRLGDEENPEMLFLPNSTTAVREVATTGAHRGIPSSDQLIGFLERYSSLKEAGRLISAHQH
ncbi:hypothetical protein HYX10_01485 [Candidatus Woesearchaeota archaeon]|nr:hypothetical protein [Candidatus Woesearchaeota archaeon]